VLVVVLSPLVGLAVEVVPVVLGLALGLAVVVVVVGDAAEPAVAAPAV
jgi:hypothetical protein